MAQLSLSHISCRNLQTSYLNRFINPLFFVSIAITDRDGSKRQQEKLTNKVTAVNGGLAWENEVMEFRLSEEKDDIYEMFYLEFKIFCYYGGLPLTDTMFGIAVVPIMDLLDKRRESLSYQVKSSMASNAFLGTLSFLLNVTRISTPPSNVGMNHETHDGWIGPSTPWTIGNNQDGYFGPIPPENIGSNQNWYYYPPPTLTPLPMGGHPQSHGNTQFYYADDLYYPPVPPPTAPQFPQ